MTAKSAGEWRTAVFARDGHRCQALHHVAACSLRAQNAHHVVFLSHLTKETRWVVDNGISLSTWCHANAHATHNANIEPRRLREAVDAVNAIIDVSKNPELRRPYFMGLEGIE